MSQAPCLHGHKAMEHGLANAAGVKDPAALQRCRPDTSLPAEGSLVYKKSGERGRFFMFIKMENLYSPPDLYARAGAQMGANNGMLSG